MKEQEWFETMESIPFLNQLDHWSNKVDSLESTGALKSKVTELPFWISFHTTGSEEITPLYIIKSSGFEWNEGNIVSILETLCSQKFETELQLFNGYELLNAKNETADLVMLIQGDYLAISEENLLVEDVVRALENLSSRLVEKGYRSKTNEGLQLILNTKRLEELSKVFFKEGSSLKASKIESVAYLDLAFKAEGLELRGAINQLAPSGRETTIFAKNLIPNSSTDFRWQPIQVGINEFEPLLKGEMLSISLDMNFSDVSEVVLLNTADTLYLRRELEKLSEAKTQAQDSTSYREFYLSTYLGYIQQRNFVQQLTGVSSEMHEPYYAIFQNTLLLSDNLDALKTVINEFDNEATWGKSVEKRRILDDIIQETDLTIFREFEYATESILENLKPKWKDFFNERPALLSILKRFQLQLNASNNNYLVSSAISFNPPKTGITPNLNESVDTPTELTVKANIFMDANLITKPFVVKNHVNSSFEIIFQDENNSLYLATRQGDILWKSQVNSQILGPIHQVDYYNNKKLQYLFFTDSLVHLIDRNGEVVEGFPKPYAAPLTIEGSAVIDYDNSKRYRYLTRDRRGNLNLYDKEVASLEGWNPKALDAALVQTPFHIRVRGRDAFVAVETTGEVNLLNRRGEDYPGFPQKFDQRFSGDVALIKGPNFAGTEIALTGQDGELIRINLEGKVTQNKQLFRPTARSKYAMVSDVLETGYRVIRNDFNRIAFFDMDGKDVFEVPLENSGELEVEFYNFRNGKELYAVRDIAKNQLFLFNNEGKQLCPIIPSSERISILFYQNLSEYEVFVNFANQLNIYAIDAQ